MKIISIEKRMTRSFLLTFAVTIGAIVTAFTIVGGLLSMVGANPFTTYRAMFTGSFGSIQAFVETLVKATPLILLGLSTSVAFRMRLWNIGAEGQLAIGAIAASGVALYWSQNLIAPLILPTMLLVGVAAGALWGLIPALLKIWGVNEILTSLMMNYIAVLLLDYFYTGPWKDPKGFGFPGSAQFVPGAWLPHISGRLHYGLYIGLLASLFIWFLLNHTKWGYEIKVIGENTRAARYAGISLTRNILLVMLVSAGLAGLSGFTEVAGITHRLQKGVSLGYGFTAIIIAWLAQLNPLAVPLVAVLFGGLLVGGDQIQITMGLPASIGTVLQGTILFCILGGEYLTRYTVRFHLPPYKQRVSSFGGNRGQ
jgi:simple sugar transport system permease protein